MTTESQLKSQKGKSKGILDRLKFLDIFGQRPIFNVNGEDEFKTIMGVLWSLLMLFVLFSGLIYYFLIYIKSKDPDVATNIIRTDEFEPIDLGEKDFFISLSYRRNFGNDTLEPIENFNKTWFRVETYHVTGVKNPQRRIIEQKKCGESGIDPTQFVGDRETAFHVNSSCIRFEKDTIIGGFPGSDEFKFVEIYVYPCDESTSVCKTYDLTVHRTMKSEELAEPGSTPKLLQTAFSKIRQFTFILSFLQTGAKLDDFENPLRKTIDSNNELRMGLFQEYFRTYFFQNYKVEDTTGWFYDIVKEHEGISLDRSTTETTTRETWFKAPYKSPSGADILRTANYMTIRLQASNQKYVITRKFKKLIDVFSDVGGLAEVITFIIAILYSWHNEIRLNQLLINEGILGHKKHKDPKQEGHLYEPLGYCEIFSFKYLSCCRNSKHAKRRMEAYEKYTSQLENRLNIVDHLQTQGKNSILQNAILQPYQIKLLPYITQEEEPGQDSTQDGSIKEEEITLIKALSVVKSQEKKSELNMMIDDWIYSHLDEEVKLLDAIETMKAPELNAAISKVAKVKSSSIIGSNRGSTLQEKMPTTQNVVVKGYESLRDREESKDFNPDE